VVDVVVVGAGPAGSSAAGRLAKAGLKVLLADQAVAVGDKVQCAEYVPRMILRHAEISPADVAQPVTGLKTYIGGQLAGTLPAPGYILHRGRWDKNNAAAVVAAGAELVTGARATGWDGEAIVLQRGRSSLRVPARIVLGGDGPRSAVARWLGNGDQPVCLGLQCQVVLKKPADYAEVYFDPAFHGGYAWLFPKGDTANVGIGISLSRKNDADRLLASFRAELAGRGIIGSAVLARTAGLIPCRGLRSRLADGRLLIAGDAAGCTHPVTGAGIMSAVVSGNLAAEAIIACFRSGDREAVTRDYPQALRAELGRQLEMARCRAEARDAAWSANPAVFPAIIRRSWVAFPEYYIHGIERTGAC
jgi:digeranylgeranylglycerophospholipid reductase